MGNLDALEYWKQQLVNKSPKTRALYENMFNGFLTWYGKTANELYDLAKEAERKSEDPRENFVVELLIKKYLADMEDRGLSANTRKTAYGAIKSFFDGNFVNLRWKHIDRPDSDASGSRIPKKEEVKAMVEYAGSQLTKAAILVAKDSGLRLSDITRLEWSQAEDYGDDFWGFQLITKKKKIKAVCFIGPEAVNALQVLKDTYAKTAKKNGRLGVKATKARIFPMDPKTLSNTISRVIHAAGLKCISGHGLRKFWNVELEGARIPKEYRYRMIGKSLRDKGTYDENRPEVLLEAYRTNYDRLRINQPSLDQERLEALEADVSHFKQLYQDILRENEMLREGHAQALGQEELKAVRTELDRQEKIVSNLVKLFSEKVPKNLWDAVFEQKASKS